VVFLFVHIHCLNSVQRYDYCVACDPYRLPVCLFIFFYVATTYPVSYGNQTNVPVRDYAMFHYMLYAFCTIKCVQIVLCLLNLISTNTFIVTEHHIVVTTAQQLLQIVKTSCIIKHNNYFCTPYPKKTDG